MSSDDGVYKKCTIDASFTPACVSVLIVSVTRKLSAISSREEVYDDGNVPIQLSMSKRVDAS